MQEKIEEKCKEISHIQNTLWKIYKEFSAKGNAEEWCNKTAALVNEYDGDMGWFCKNLVVSWKTTIDGIAGDMRNGLDTREKHDCIKNIQNTLWSLYKRFLVDKNIKGYTDKAAALVHEYDGKKDMMLFAQTLILSWVPVINSLAADFRGEGGDDVCK